MLLRLLLRETIKSMLGIWILFGQDLSERAESSDVLAPLLETDLSGYPQWAGLGGLSLHTPSENKAFNIFFYQGWSELLFFFLIVYMFKNYLFKIL